MRFKHLNKLKTNDTKIKIDVIIEPVSMKEGLPDGHGNYDAQTLDDWYDFASTIESMIDKFCDTVNISLSRNPNSISEYIDFYVYNEDGSRKDYVIDLRLSDHSQTTNARQIRKDQVERISERYKLKTITINNVSYDSYEDAIKAIRKFITEETLKGSYD